MAKTKGRTWNNIAWQSCSCTAGLSLTPSAAPGIVIQVRRQADRSIDHRTRPNYKAQVYRPCRQQPTLPRSAVEKSVT